MHVAPACLAIVSWSSPPNRAGLAIKQGEASVGPFVKAVASACESGGVAISSTSAPESPLPGVQCDSAPARGRRLQRVDQINYQVTAASGGRSGVCVYKNGAAIRERYFEVVRSLYRSIGVEIDE